MRVGGPGEVRDALRVPHEAVEERECGRRPNDDRFVEGG